jgi:hypothetical protein
VAHRAALELVEAVPMLGINGLTFLPEQDPDAAIAIADPHLCDLPDGFAENSLLWASGQVMVRGARCRHCLTGSPDRHTEGGTNKIDHLPSPSRRHIFRPMTSESVSLSGVRSATSLRSRVFSSSRSRRRRTSEGMSPRSTLWQRPRSRVILRLALGLPGLAHLAEVETRLLLGRWKPIPTEIP